MRQFKINPLVLAMAVVLPATVHAQDNSNETIEEVVVTGSYAQSLKNALNVKRESTSIVDYVFEEDI